MAKEHVHIGLAVAFDGPIPLPGRANLISVSGYGPGGLSYSANIRPPLGRYNGSKFWDKHPDEFTKLKRDTVSLKEALTGLTKWMKEKYEGGSYIAVTSSVDFWFLLHGFEEVGVKSPFHLGIPFDIDTYYGREMGGVIPYRPGSDLVLPSEIAKFRQDLIGVRPSFGRRGGRKIAPPPPPPPRPNGWRLNNDELLAAIRGRQQVVTVNPPEWATAIRPLEEF